MKHLYSIIFFLFIHSISFGQQPNDTCDYIAQYNQIGGLDCAMGSLAGFTADSYQWLDCDNNMAPFQDDTMEYFMNFANQSGWVALEITAAGCVDTSECNFACVWGIEELDHTKKEVIRVIDLMGRSVKDEPNSVLIYFYSDGTSKKVIRVE